MVSSVVCFGELQPPGLRLVFEGSPMPKDPCMYRICAMALKGLPHDVMMYVLQALCMYYK